MFVGLPVKSFTVPNRYVFGRIEAAYAPASYVVPSVSETFANSIQVPKRYGWVVSLVSAESW